MVGKSYIYRIIPIFWCPQKKKSRSDRTYGGVALQLSKKYVAESRISNLKSAPYKCIPPESSSFSEEDTWTVLEREKCVFSKLYHVDSFCFLGDFNSCVGSTREMLWSVHDGMDVPVGRNRDDIDIVLPQKMIIGEGNFWNFVIMISW